MGDAAADVTEIGWGKAAWVSSIAVALLITVVGIALFAILILSSMRSFLRAFSWFSAPPGSPGGASPGSARGAGNWFDGRGLLGAGVAGS